MKRATAAQIEKALLDAVAVLQDNAVDVRRNTDMLAGYAMNLNQEADKIQGILATVLRNAERLHERQNLMMTELENRLSEYDRKKTTKRKAKP